MGTEVRRSGTARRPGGPGARRPGVKTTRCPARLRPRSQPSPAPARALPRCHLGSRDHADVVCPPPGRASVRGQGE
eukprot:6077352-Lingulodinium_polyedra.AAC.1